MPSASTSLTYSDGSPRYDANGKPLPPPPRYVPDPLIGCASCPIPVGTYFGVDSYDPYNDPNLRPKVDPASQFPTYDYDFSLETPDPMPDDYNSDEEWYADQVAAYNDEQNYAALFGEADGDFLVGNDTPPDPSQPDLGDYGDGYDPQLGDDSSDSSDPDIFAGLSNIENNGDGTYTNLDTGLIFDAAGNVVGGDTQQDQAEILGFTPNGDGTYTNEHTGNITDADGNVIFTLNQSGTYDNVNTGKTEDFYNVAGKNDSPATSWWDQLFGTVAGGAGKIAGGVSSGGGGGGGSGSSSTKSSGGTPANPSTGSAPKKTIVSDNRVGNDRVITYSDGSVQRLPNFYAAPTGTTAKPPATISSVLDSIFGVGAKLLGAVPATPNGPAQVQTAAQAAAIQAAQAKQVATNAQLAAAQKNSVPLTPAQKAAAAKAAASNPLPLLVVAAIAAKFLIFN